MFFAIIFLLVSGYGHVRVANGIVLPFMPVPDDVCRAESGSACLPMESLIASLPSGSIPSLEGWTINVDSAQAGYPGTNTLDNLNLTIWHSEYSPVSHNLPHSVIIDTKEIRNINGLLYTPRQDGGANGNIGRHQIYVSTDGINFGDPVAFGTWYDDQTNKTAAWEPKRARYIKLIAITEAGNRGQWSSAAGFYVYTSATIETTNGIGAWGPTINFPLVPAAAAVEPDSGNVLTWSSYTYFRFSSLPGLPNGGKTLTSIYNPTSGIVSERMVTNTDHDMFCPGISFDATGRIVVTGGNNAQKTSIYTGGSDNWQSGRNLNIARAYQSQVTMGDGRIFLIGGSWNGGVGNKNGEIYDPKTNVWTKLPLCPVAPMLTADYRGAVRADNHGMLFNWKNGYVFQAGPSRAMNWYNTKGTGGQAPAGTRGDDLDAMCGTATMYDAVKGSVLVTGGSKYYETAYATSNANIITIGNPDTVAQVEKINPMWYRRTFGTSVVLPDGKVFITGGQELGETFSDALSILTSEIFHPDTNKFVRTVGNSTPRNYHSWSLLLQDATVLVGGGGLCWTCSTNHFDAQVFIPPYLLNPTTGARLAQPQITSVSSRANKPGSTITVKTATPVTSFSMIRYGTATHTVNTDQRRIALTPTNAGTNTYELTLGIGDYGVVTPGYWMLFAMNSDGVPSHAYTILIN